VFVDPAVALPEMYQIDYLDQMADIYLDLQASGNERFAANLMRDVSLGRHDDCGMFLLSSVYIPMNAMIRIYISDMYERKGLRSPLAASSDLYWQHALNRM
jgi:hypothetical protein